MSDETTALAPMLRVGQLAHWATLGRTLAALLAQADVAADAETAEAIAATRNQLGAVSLDAIGEHVVVLTAALDAAPGPLAAGLPLTLPQAASVIGIAPASAIRAVHEGRLRAAKVGGRWQTTIADVRAYLDTPRQPGGRPRKGATQ